MKILTLMILGLLFLGCSAPGTVLGTFSDHLNALKTEDVIGTYQNPGNPKRTLVFLKNGSTESRLDGRKELAEGHHGKWKIHGREVHFTVFASPNATDEEKFAINALGMGFVYRMELLKSDLTVVAIILGGKRAKANKASQATFKKIK